MLFSECAPQEQVLLLYLHILKDGIYKIVEKY